MEWKLKGISMLGKSLTHIQRPRLEILHKHNMIKFSDGTTISENRASKQKQTCDVHQKNKDRSSFYQVYLLF
jgi:hypothetical protein